MATEDDALSEFSESEIPLGGEYSDMVALQQIEDAMSEGSILSGIDWDQVDALIATVDPYE